MAIKGVFGLPFKEQEEFFRNKLNLPTKRWDDIKQSGHDRGFVVAGALKADLLADIHTSLDKHMAGGGGLAGYRKDFPGIVKTHGWTGWTGEGTKAGEAWRTKVTFMTNLRVSYAAGRNQQLKESGVKWLMWKHSGLAKEPRAEHLAWDGLILPADHPFWKLHSPPQIPPNWNCRCRVVGVTNPELARSLGGDPDKKLPKGWEKVDAKYKTQGPGWNYAPGANAMMPLREMVEKKLITYPPAIRKALKNELAGVLAGLATIRAADNAGMKTITDHAGQARATDGKTRHLPLAPVASHEKISAATGIDLAEFTHVLDAAKIRHILDTHGDPVKEARQGQRAVVEADFAKLTLVVDAHDVVTLSARPANGNLSVLEFMKRIGDEEFHYRAEIRTGKKHLAPATLFIKVVK